MTIISDYLTTNLAGVSVVSSEDESPTFNLKQASLDIYQLLNGVMPEVAGIKQVFPASNISERNYPDAVYNIASGPLRKTYKNTVIAYTTLYDVIIRDKSHADLMTLVASVESAINSSPGYQRVDSADDYLDEEDAYRVGLNIEVSRPISADLTQVPAKSIMVSSADFNANASQYDNCISQRKNYQIEVISTATSQAGLKVLRADVESLLLGWKQADGWTRAQLVDGAELQADAGLYSAVDTYVHSKMVSQAG